MITCPYCGADRDTTVYSNVFKCGSHHDKKGTFFRTACCKNRQPLFIDLQSAKAKILHLVSAGDEIIANGSVSERLANKWKAAKEMNP